MNFRDFRARSASGLLAAAMLSSCGTSKTPAPDSAATAVPTGAVRLADGLPKLSSRLPEPRPASAELFAEARALFDSGSWLPAAERFAVFVLRDPKDPQAIHAVHFLGLAQEKLDDIEGTLEAFEYQLANYPNADVEPTCEALFKIAESHYRRGRNADAELNWRRIMADHPNSRWAEWARERVHTLAKVQANVKPCCGDTSSLPPEIQERIRIRQQSR
jgi:TolA-binding protein